MLPLRDSVRSDSYPVVTKAIILLNVAVFVWELALGRHLPQAFVQLAVIPARYTHPGEAAEVFGAFSGVGAAVLPFFTSMFLHGGWMHLIGNMWTLWIFGDNVEDRLGKLRFIAFYVGSGLVAAVAHVLTNSHSGVPTLGASGAIAGVMGAYFRFFPKARVETLIPPFFFGPTFELPAVVFLGWWFLLQFFNGTASLASPGKAYGGIAWWAHVGGFVFGLGIALLVRAKHRRSPRFIEI
jgi:membrane associated rhomboid family serine protease